MGCSLRKPLTPEQEAVDPAELKQMILCLEVDIEQLKKERKREESTHKKELETKQAEWKRERKLLQEEIATLTAACRSATLICEEKKKCVVGTAKGTTSGESAGMAEELRIEWCRLLGEQMKEQRKREEAAEKWKTLYLTIKSELDQLIQATAILSDPRRQGEERLCAQWMKEELKRKEEINRELRAKVSEIEKANAKREREIDILRQSLRIMTTNPHKKQHTRTSYSKSLNLKADGGGRT